MTRFLLCRHGSTNAVARTLVGRAPGIPLNARGRVEAQALARELAREPLVAVASSPLERALETARAIAAPHALEVEIQEELIDLDFGNWTGRAIAELAPDPDFQRFNTHRSLTRAPGGEHALEVQARMLHALEALALEFPHATLAVVSHADPLKTLLGYFLGVPLDFMSRIHIDTGSFSVLDLGPESVTVHAVNRVPAGVD